MKTATKKHVLRAVLLMATVMVASHSAYADSVACGDCIFATDSELEIIRGGFVSNDGLEITFGIEKTVFVNGVLQAINTLNIQDWNSKQSQTLSDQVLANMVILRQNGDNNSLVPNLVANSQGGLFTYIQNSLDNTVIKNVTQISATVNSLNMFRDMNLKSLMNQQLINAVK